MTDDEVSEREEVRDSNYVGTDLYWENRFYQVKPFKKPVEESMVHGGAKNEFDMIKSDDTGEEGHYADAAADYKPPSDAAFVKSNLSEDINDKEFVMI